MTDDEKIARTHEMLKAWDACDWDAVAAMFAEDGVLHSVMKEPVVGRATIDAHLQPFRENAHDVDLQVKSIGVIGGRVFVERVDVFDYAEHHGEVPVVGILSWEDGLVTEWLEYYDRATLLRGMGAA
ncbi:nuclear transport factor 2 family protein [Aeromicrobium alkaliterrae]|uniref:SnoaL-like domain-containing protein n=1 Tax=Aeromicrobium alkaliterrae TaxID=302168 RepID=A0ABN2K4P7_9ACTN